MPKNPGGQVVAKPEFSEGWQNAGYRNKTEFSNHAGIDPKTVEKIQRLEPVSVTVISKYAQALGKIIADVIDEESEESANRTIETVDMQNDFPFKPWSSFGVYDENQYTAISMKIDLTEVNGEKLYEMSKKNSFESHWDEIQDKPVRTPPIWQFSSQIDKRSPNLEANLMALQEALGEALFLEVKDYGLESLIQSLTRSNQVNDALNKLREEHDLHVLGGYAKTYVFDDYWDEERGSRWALLTYPIFLITATTQRVANAVVQVVMEKKGILTLL